MEYEREMARNVAIKEQCTHEKISSTLSLFFMQKNTGKREERERELCLQDEGEDKGGIVVVGDNFLAREKIFFHT